LKNQLFTIAQIDGHRLQVGIGVFLFVQKNNCIKKKKIKINSIFDGVETILMEKQNNNK